MSQVPSIRLFLLCDVFSRGSQIKSPCFSSGGTRVFQVRPDSDQETKKLVCIIGKMFRSDMNRTSQSKWPPFQPLLVVHMHPKWATRPAGLAPLKLVRSKNLVLLMKWLTFWQTTNVWPCPSVPGQLVKFGTWRRTAQFSMVEDSGSCMCIHSYFRLFRASYCTTTEDAIKWCGATLFVVHIAHHVRTWSMYTLKFRKCSYSTVFSMERANRRGSRHVEDMSRQTECGIPTWSGQLHTHNVAAKMDGSYCS